MKGGGVVRVQQRTLDEWYSSLSVGVVVQRDNGSAHVVVNGAKVMVVDLDLQRGTQLARDEGKCLVPFRVQIAVHNQGTVLELPTFELYIRIASPWGVLKIDC